MPAKQAGEIFCVFVGEVHSCAVDGVDGDRCGDELSESIRPFRFEQEVVAGAPDDERRCG